MKRHAGFTLIELLITISIMLILLTLTVVSLRSSQANARDEERKTDVATIARYLETFYDTGPHIVSLRHTPSVQLAAFHPARLVSFTPDPQVGQYPSTAQMDSDTDIQATLSGIDPDSLRAPGVGASSISLTVATTTATPTPDINTYVYLPLQSDGTLCDATFEECRKFTLFYKLETTGAVQSVISKNQ